MKARTLVVVTVRSRPVLCSRFQPYRTHCVLLACQIDSSSKSGTQAMVERSEGSGNSVIDGREYSDRPGLFSYGSGVLEV